MFSYTVSRHYKNKMNQKYVFMLLRFSQYVSYYGRLWTVVSSFIDGVDEVQQSTRIGRTHGNLLTVAYLGVTIRLQRQRGCLS